MINKKSIALVIVGIIVGLLISAGSNSMLGGVYNQVTNEFYEGIKAGKTNQFVIDNAGAITTAGAITSTGDGVFGGGTLNVTTSNSATSTVTAGCFQFYATSTATANKFQASTTPGIMYSVYGTCPNN